MPRNELKVDFQLAAIRYKIECLEKSAQATCGYKELNFERGDAAGNLRAAVAEAARSGARTLRGDAS